MQGAVCGVYHLFPHLHAAIVPYPYSGHKISRDNKKVPPDSFPVGGKMLALPIFPGRRQPSIVGRDELNYRVRNGNGWTLALISTNLCHPVSPENKLYYTLFALFCQEISIPKPQTSATFAIRKGKAAEGTSFRTCAEACGPQLALTW